MPIVPLWLLVIASQLPDWIDVIVCTARPGTLSPAIFSHSFPAIAALAGSMGLVGRYFFGSWYVAKVLALLVFSHILGDYITGIKPTWAGGPRIGLRLYSRPLLDFFFESAIIAWGWWMYRSAFRPVQRDTFAVRGMLVGLIALQAVADLVFAVVPGITKCG